MEKTNELCGGASNKPLYQLANLIAMLERQEEERKRKEQEKAVKS